MLFKLLVLFSLTYYSNAFIIHNVPRGEVGIYYRFSRLLPETTTSDTYLKFPPPYTFSSSIQITPQTDVIYDVKCGASDGTQMSFEQIAVGNHLREDMVIRAVTKFGENYDDYLVKNKVRSQIYVICSKLSSDEIYNTKFDTIDDELFKFLQEDNKKESESGVVIDFVRMSKPRIPESLQQKYNQIAQEKLHLQIANAEATTLEQVHQNEKYKAVAAAEKLRAVSEKENEKNYELKIHQQKLQTMDDERLFKMKNQEKKREAINRIIKYDNQVKDAEAKFESTKKIAEGNKLLLTSEYLDLKKSEAFYNNAKHYGQINPTLFLSEGKTTSEKQVYMSKYDKLNQ